MPARRSMTREYQGGEVEAMVANRNSGEGGWGGRSVMLPSAPRVAETFQSRSGSAPWRKPFKIGALFTKTSTSRAGRRYRANSS